MARQESRQQSKRKECATGAGARVVVTDVDPAKAKAVVATIREAGGEALLDTHSVDSWQGGGRIVDACLERFDRIDGLVASAHQVKLRPIWDLRESDLDHTFDVHVKGHFSCVHHAARAMREQGSPEGWSVEDLSLYFRETVGASLEMPGMDVPRYRWYDGVK